MFDKLDAYNLIANLVPGAALMFALNYLQFPTPSPTAVVPFLLISFVAGVAANRIGALVIDPFLRSEKVGILHPKNYKAYLEAEKIDKKLDPLVANAGLYRTFFTSGFIIIILMIIRGISTILHLHASRDVYLIIFIVTGMIVFLYALKREDNYIKSRLGD